MREPITCQVSDLIHNIIIRSTSPIIRLRQWVAASMGRLGQTRQKTADAYLNVKWVRLFADRLIGTKTRLVEGSYIGLLGLKCSQLISH